MEKNFFCFGNSITQGYWDTDGGWVSKLNQFLFEKCLEEPENYHFGVHNMGVSGNDSDQLNKRFRSEIEARVSESSDNVILIQIGANDAQFIKSKQEPRVSETDFRDNVEDLIEKSREYADEVIVLGNLYSDIEGSLPWAKDKIVEDEREERYNEIKRNVCSEKNVNFIDFRREFSKEEFLDKLEDGVHPDGEGHELIFARVKKCLKENGIIDF